MSEKNCILIDWFAMSFRAPGVTPESIIRLLDLKCEAKFEHLSGRYLYRDRLSFGGIHIYYNNINKDQDYPMLEMTGQGCREFETYSRLSFDYLFELAKDDLLYHMTRLDIAYDDHIGILDIRQIEKDYRAHNWVSRSRRGRITIDLSREKDDDGKNIEGISVMTGTKSSDMYMRIYDKGIERGFKDGRHWVRCELVLKQDRAVKFLKCKEKIGEKFRGVIAGYFRFIDPESSDTNRSRVKMRDYWSKFLENASKISVYSKKEIEYNLGRVYGYVMHQAGNSIYTYIKIVGIMKFLDDLFKRNSKLTPQQRYLINKCKAAYKDQQNIDPDILQAIADCFRS